MPAVDDDQLGTQTQRVAGWHRRPDAELAGRIRGRSHHPALVWQPPDDERLSPQGSIPVFLNRTEKRVQVDMQDFAWHAVVFPSRWSVAILVYPEKEEASIGDVGEGGGFIEKMLQYSRPG